LAASCQLVMCATPPQSLRSFCLYERVYTAALWHNFFSWMVAFCSWVTVRFPWQGASHLSLCTCVPHPAGCHQTGNPNLCLPASAKCHQAIAERLQSAIKPARSAYVAPPSTGRHQTIAERVRTTHCLKLSPSVPWANACNPLESAIKPAQSACVAPPSTGRHQPVPWQLRAWAARPARAMGAGVGRLSAHSWCVPTQSCCGCLTGGATC